MALIIPIRLPTNGSFDFYIAPGGNDANPGTLQAPWSLSAINTKQATYAGKKVGIVAGTYSFTALGINQAVSDFGQCALQIATGTPTSQTVIASCDSSGNYSPRAAIFDCGTTLANNPNQGGAIGTYGSPGPNGSSGYITIDGLEIKNAIAAAIQVAFVTGTGAPSSRYKGIVIQNNYIHNITLPSGGSAGANLSGIELYACDGAQVLNNYITDIQDLVPSNGDGDPFRSFGIKAWTSINCSVRLNTVYAGTVTQSPCGGIDFKNANNWSNEVAYNFIHMKNAASLLEGAVVVSSSGGNSSLVSSVHHNVIVGDPAVVSSDLGTDPTQDGFQIYQNTFVGVPDWSVVGVERFTEASLLTHYGNIYNRTTANTQRGDINCNVNSPALSDFNWYPATPALGATAAGSTGDPSGGPKTSITAWQSAITSIASADSHSLTSATTFSNASASGLLATDYQLPGTYGNAGSSAGSGASRVGGVITGATANMGAWDGVVTQIGCNFMSP